MTCPTYEQLKKTAQDRRIWKLYCKPIYGLKNRERERFLMGVDNQFGQTVLYNYIDNINTF